MCGEREPDRLVHLIRAAIRHCDLDLRDLEVLTEAASGAYAVTPVVAALAGARVNAITRSTRYGTVEEVERQTFDLADLAGITGRIAILREKTKEAVARADIITNTGHVRPIDAAMLDLAKPTAVVPLMYESWELRPQDIDLAACARREIAVAGTNENHPTVDLLPAVGSMALRLWNDAGLALQAHRVLLWCDNPFRSILAEALSRAEATVETIAGAEQLVARGRVDAILVATRPRPTPIIGESEAEAIASSHPGATVVQFWGDVDRGALTRRRVPFWPIKGPAPGHQTILPSDVAPDALVRLQTGSLKVGEIMARVRLRGGSREDAIDAAVSSGFGQAVPFPHEFPPAAYAQLSPGR
jgi:hypothetical protein